MLVNIGQLAISCILIKVSVAAHHEPIISLEETTAVLLSEQSVHIAHEILSGLRILLLFIITAIAEIVGCYLPWLVLKQDKSPLLLIPAAVSLAFFAWLLTLHPTAAGRTYAAYGGVYIAVAIGWLWGIEGIRPNLWDIIGSLVALLGMAIIMLAPRN